MAALQPYLRTTLAAALLLFGMLQPRAQNARLEGAAAWQKLVGNTVVATTKGGGYTEFYDPDGTVRRTDGDGPTRGRWTQADDGVCLDYPDDDDRICFRVSLDGTSGLFTDADGTADRFTVLPGNAKNL